MHLFSALFRRTLGFRRSADTKLERKGLGGSCWMLGGWIFGGDAIMIITINFFQGAELPTLTLSSGKGNFGLHIYLILDGR